MMNKAKTNAPSNTMTWQTLNLSSGPQKTILDPFGKAPLINCMPGEPGYEAICTPKKQELLLHLKPQAISGIKSLEFASHP
ncbi:hypothetical protein V6N13_098544 [Hibiscus sabdariffa]